MAKVSEKTVTTTTYTLELSEREARTLKLILGQVGGVSPIREESDAIYEALPNHLYDEKCFTKFQDGSRVLHLVDGADF